MNRRSFLSGFAALSLPAIFPRLGNAQNYPTKLIRYVIGFPPGGSADLVARLYAERMSPVLGQSYVIENVPGASANIASSQVARAERDGHTLLFGGSFSHAINPSMFKLSFDVLRDFTPVSLLTVNPNVVAVNAGLGVKSAAEMVEHSKRTEGGLFYATSNVGFQIAAAQIAKATGARLVNVPFKGGAEAVTSVIAGNVPMIIGTPPTILPHIQSGSLIGLMLTTADPSPLIPDVPGARDAGVPGVDTFTWYGLFGPAGIPTYAVEKLHAAIGAAAKDDGMGAKFAREGMMVSVSASPAEFANFVKTEFTRYAALIREAGLGAK